jgi:hypothetical protein
MRPFLLEGASSRRGHTLLTKAINKMASPINNSRNGKPNIKDGFPIADGGNDVKEKKGKVFVNCKQKG